MDSLESPYDKIEYPTLTVKKEVLFGGILNTHNLNYVKNSYDNNTAEDEHDNFYKQMQIKLYK